MRVRTAKIMPSACTRLVRQSADLRRRNSLRDVRALPIESEELRSLSVTFEAAYFAPCRGRHRRFNNGLTLVPCTRMDKAMTLRLS